ncbi:MAG: ATP-binding protein [Candidatus Omnitrophica bacterium]|nr:ATP-binding protein [Candidatus Omnitrophota bacterium]
MSDTNLEKNFFGRTDVLGLLKKRVIDLKEGCRQNVALLGSQYVGKSAILHDFLSNLDETDVTAIYLDLENKDFNYFFSKFTGSLLYNFSRNHRLPLHDDLNVLLESTKESIPQTVQVIRKIQKDFNNGKLSAAFLGLLTLPEIFTNETGKFCILILDEFQNLEEFGVPHVFANLGKKIMTQKRCFYIMSSSFKGAAKNILSEKLSLLFGNFETIDIDIFDAQTSQKFVEHNLKGLRIGNELRNFLTDFTGGHPLYLKLICRELISLTAIYKQNEIYLPLLSQAVENTIFDRWGVISRHFELVVNELCRGKGNRTIALILISLSKGKYKIDDIIQDTGIKKNKIMQKMTRLIELGVVVKNGNFHYFKDKLFKYWTKYVYQRRLCDVELAPDKQRLQFKEEFDAGVEDFNVATRQDFSSRIIDLFYCFDNEALHLNGRKYKLPVFREITPCRFRDDGGNYVDVIKASTKDAVWFVVSKREHVGENDVNMILREAKRIDPRPERYMIISMMDLDENTRLKALQERFWIWNEQELNTLLSLFDKPYILR